LAARNVRFRYLEKGPLVLDGITFTLKPGRFVVLKGKSGSGKTTLFKVLLGLSVPDGKLVLGGYSYQQIGWYRYREFVTGTLQGDRLFAGTLAENIASFSTAPDHKFLVECAKMAGIHEAIQKFPLKYTTPIGDMRVSLSAGQVQRVLLARALYTRPRILLLDEALSQLDYEEEIVFLTKIKERGISCIVVSGRSDLSRIADESWTLSEGKVVVEIGAPRVEGQNVVSLNPQA